MARREYHYRWTWDLESTPEQLWPLVADTNRFDRDAGVPEVNLLEDAEPLPAGRAHVRVRQYGIALDYVQDPFEWEAPHHFAVTRRFTTGPLASLRIRADLEATPSGGTRLTYQVWASPRNLLGHSIPVQIGVVLRRRFDQTFRTYDRLAAAGDLAHRTGGRARLADHATARIAAARTELATGTAPLDPAGLATFDRLTHTLADADDVAVARLRPYELADRWDLDRRAVLETCLLATRAGLLRFRWDVLCPQCRIAKGSAAHLVDLPIEVHCETCHIDYTANFARSVELTFAPSPTIRAVDTSEYCVGNPAATPHIVGQVLVAPGATATLGPLEDPGRYRVRGQDLAGAAHVQVLPTPPASETDGRATLDGAVVAIDADGWPDEERTVTAGSTLDVRNDRDDEVLVIIERTTWGDQAVTAAEVTALQRFRDLFADEALRPGEQVQVGTMTIAFTDLCDSTALYQRIGDAVAFGKVLDHFEVLRDCVDDAGGTIVKTIGDAVMAAFPDAASAVAAMLAAQERFLADGINDPRLRLKVGVHTGPCIAVTLNGRLDYFGSTVNLAARLEGCATGDDVVISGETHDDPAVQELLAGDDLTVEQLTASLKGFADERELWRLRPVPHPAAGALSPSASSG